MGLSEAEQQSLQALLKKRQSSTQNMEKHRQESKQPKFIGSYIHCILDIRKRSATMSAEEEMGLNDEEDGDDDDPLTRASHRFPKRRKHSLDEEEAQLAYSLGSDLPDWDNTHVSTTFSAHSPSPSPSLPPSPDPGETSRSDLSQSKFSHVC
jgi:hypothetical protein